MGVEVTAKPDGAILGAVEEVLVDREARCATGVVLGRGVHEALAVRFADLSASFDPSPRLTVPGVGSAALLSRMFPADDALQGVGVIGTEALSDRGTLLGMVQDVIIDMATGDITALDVIGEHCDRAATVSVDAVLRFGPQYTVIVEDRWNEETRV